MRLDSFSGRVLQGLPLRCQNFSSFRFDFARNSILSLTGYHRERKRRMELVVRLLLHRQNNCRFDHARVLEIAAMFVVRPALRRPTYYGTVLGYFSTVIWVRRFRADSHGEFSLMPIRTMPVSSTGLLSTMTSWPSGDLWVFVRSSQNGIRCTLLRVGPILEFV